MSGIRAIFSQIEDPRAGNVRHRLGDVVLMMVCASLCGASSATEMALFAEQRRAALSRLIDYGAAPSHDTFSRLLRLICPERLGDVLSQLAAGMGRAVADEGGPAVVALDGKALRRAYEKGCAAAPPLTVTAFATQTRLSLGAYRPKAGENEVEAALKLVQMLDLKGQIVTADALHCHHRMAEAVIRRGGHYLLALKGNRGSWLKQAEAVFNDDAPAQISSAQTAHGRQEHRSIWVRPAPAPCMAGHAAFVKIVAQRDGGAPQTRFFLASRPFDAEQAMAIARAHWRIENNLHWTLDVLLDEDNRRARKDHAPANTAILTRLARNILQCTDSPKVAISHRLKKCAWNDSYLVTAIGHMR
jgi:predicted transposase YbfD/YdcC